VDEDDELGLDGGIDEVYDSMEERDEYA